MLCIQPKQHASQRKSAPLLPAWKDARSACKPSRVHHHHTPTYRAEIRIGLRPGVASPSLPAHVSKGAAMQVEPVRVNHDGTLVVPPFECAWLTGPAYELKGGAGCVVFESKGETDVTVLLKPRPGTKRLQPLQPATVTPTSLNAALVHTPSSSSGLVGMSEANYTVILGSHRNSCLKVEKNGSTVCQVQTVPGSKVSAREFQQFWIDYHDGVLSIGTGEPGVDTISQQWTDPQPILELTSVGLSCWDRHVSYRNIRVLPSQRFKPQPCLLSSSLQNKGSTDAPTTAASASPPSLVSLCAQQLAEHMGTQQVPACKVAQAAELLLPTTRPLYRASLDYMARHFQQIVAPSQLVPTTPHALLSLPHLSHSSVCNTPTQQHPSATPLDSNNHAAAEGCQGQNGPAAAVHVVADGSSAELQPASDNSVQDEGFEYEDSGFEQLPVGVLCDLLQQNSIAVSEKCIFDAVVQWAEAAVTATTQERASVSAACDSLIVPSGKDHTHGVESVQHQTHTFGYENHSGDALGRSRTSSGCLRLNATDACAGVAEGPSGPSSSRSLGAGPSTANILWTLQPEEDVVSRVLSLVRYPLMTPQELFSVLQNPLVSSRPALLALVQEAAGLGQTDGVADGMLSHYSSSTEGLSTPPAPARAASSPAAANGLFAIEQRRMLHCDSQDAQRASSIRFQRRALPACHECSFVRAGDQNGVLHFVGTQYGAQEWVNPVLARRVDVRASSPAGRHTDPKALAGDHFPRINFSGPRYVNGKPDTWWLVDLGSTHALIITYYTLRTDGSGDYIRNWVLQGSNDMMAWTDLRTHKSDHTFKRPGQYASWPVMGPAAQAPYRAFRLLLSGPNSSSQAPHTFPLAHLELYGYLHRSDLLQQQTQQQQQQQQHVGSPSASPASMFAPQVAVVPAM